PVLGYRNRTFHYISIMSLLPYLARVVARGDLPAAEAESAMQIILDGAATHPQIAAFLIALKMKGETAAELVGFARAMRRMAATHLTFRRSRRSWWRAPAYTSRSMGIDPSPVSAAARTCWRRGESGSRCRST